MKPKLLIVDDDDEFRAQMRWALAADYDVLLAGDRKSAVSSFRSALPAAVLLDLGLPPSPHAPDEGLATLSELLAIDSLAKILVVTGQGEKAVALKAIGTGAHDFLGKPLDLDELHALLKRCFHVVQLERECRDLQRRLQGDTFEGLMGGDASMQAVFNTIRKVAGTEAPVLILGESGTGKEMTARAIHARSGRKNGPFLAINCGAIPEALMESELFGHERGAFTGAHVERKGRIESAAGGTLFLDEIGELPPALQVKLLRFLQERCIERVGGRREIPIDTRVIAATNADLKKRMGEGTFREDLFYRLAVVQILLPPLRNRGGDIELLACSFLQGFAPELGRKGLTFSAGALRQIRLHPWPGNIRELQNCVKRAVIMTANKTVTAQDLELSTTSAPERNSFLKDARDGLERSMLQDALRKHSGNITAAALELGISRSTFYELMERLGVQKPDVPSQG